MSIKDSAMNFFTNGDVDNSGYSRPQLLKSGRLDIIVRTPKTFDDVREYADCLISGNAIMISFEAVDATVKNRIFDYINGVAYVTGATVSRVNEELLLYAPSQVGVNKENVVKRSNKFSWFK